MALFSHHQHSSPVFFGFLLFLVLQGASGAIYTFVNKCNYTVWPGVSGRDSDLGTTGFELTNGSSRIFESSTGWGGRIWGRAGCTFDGYRGNCSTGDCGSGEVSCNGAGAKPPVTLAEFTLDSSGSVDFYDVSLVDGYNLPMMVEAIGRSGSCATTGCWADLNRLCPSELRVDGGDACKGACEAFGKPEYCCTGEFSSRSKCKPSNYSQMFKSACPKAYSYPYDDATSTFTCAAGANYTITFCPPSSPSQNSSSQSSPNATISSPNATISPPESGSDLSPDDLAALASCSTWLANLLAEAGASTRSQPFAASNSAFFVAVAFFVFLLAV